MRPAEKANYFQIDCTELVKIPWTLSRSVQGLCLKRRIEVLDLSHPRCSWNCVPVRPMARTTGRENDNCETAAWCHTSHTIQPNLKMYYLALVEMKRRKQTGRGAGDRKRRRQNRRWNGRGKPFFLLSSLKCSRKLLASACQPSSTSQTCTNYTREHVCIIHRRSQFRISKEVATEELEGERGMGKKKKKN